MLSSSHHSCVALGGHLGRKEAAERQCTLCSFRTKRICPFLEDIQTAATAVIFFSLQRSFQWTPDPGPNPSEPTKGCSSLCSKSCAGLAPGPKMHGRKKASCTSLGSVCLIVFISQLTREGGERGKEKKKKAKNKAEEIAQCRPYQDGSGRELVP